MVHFRQSGLPTMIDAISATSRSSSQSPTRARQRRSFEVVGLYLQFEAYRLFQPLLALFSSPECGERPRVRACTQMPLFICSLPHPIACIRITDRPASGFDLSLAPRAEISRSPTPEPERASHEIKLTDANTRSVVEHSPSHKFWRATARPHARLVPPRLAPSCLASPRLTSPRHLLATSSPSTATFTVTIV